MNETPKLNRPVPEPRNFSKPFWDGAKEKKFMIQYCTKFGKYQFFPRPTSIYTGGQGLEWREATGKATLYSYTVTRRGPPAFHGQEPYVIGSIQLEEGPRIMTTIVNCEVDDIKIGMNLRLTWDEINEDYNYPVFEPDA